MTDTRPLGWHSRGYLPHLESEYVVQTVVFRLADSIPKHVLEARHETALTVETLDSTLDLGAGACWLRRPEIAELAERALLHFDDEHYALLAWCVMPNHVHVMLEMRRGFRLGDQVKSWKTFTAAKPTV